MFKNTAKKMAYTINTTQDTNYSVFRVERGFPFQRAGRPVTAVPQFKGLNLYSHTPQNALSSFGTATPTATIAWPSRGK